MNSPEDPAIERSSGELAKNIIFGAQQASSFLRKVATGEQVGGRKYSLDSTFVTELHRRVVYGQLKDTGLRTRYGVWLGGIPVSNYAELPTKMYLYGKWLEGAAEQIREDPENTILALEIACAAHYGLVQRDFHPFFNGNGRTARGVSNALLMLSTPELRIYNLAIPPVPLVRDGATIGEQYIEALRSVDETEVLNPLMVFMAKRWRENLTDRLGKIEEKIPNPRWSGDKSLIVSIKQRIEELTQFVEQGDVTHNGNLVVEAGTKYPVPKYFDPTAPRINSLFSKVA